MKAGENEHVEFHVNDSTSYINKLLREVDRNGVSLSDHRCYYTIGKHDDIEEYVLMDGDKKPVLVARDAFGMECKVIAYKMEIREMLDIRTMAETREVPRVI